VEEVAEESVAEGIVAEILYQAAAVGVGAGLLEIGLGGLRKAFQQCGFDRAGPQRIHYRHMGKDGICRGSRAEAKYEGERKCGSFKKHGIVQHVDNHIEMAGRCKRIRPRAQ
jgi:hypothetical protein